MTDNNSNNNNNNNNSNLKIEKKPKATGQLWYLPKYMLMEEMHTRYFLVWMIILICSLLVMLLIWASFASIDEKAVTFGELIPTGRIKIVQSAEGGLVSAVLAKNHTYVKAHELIVQLNDVQYKADLNRLKRKQKTLLEDVRRLSLYIQGDYHQYKSSDISEEEQSVLKLQNKSRVDQVSIMDTQIQVQKEEVERIATKIKLTKENLTLLNEEVAMYESLFEKG